MARALGFAELHPTPGFHNLISDVIPWHLTTLQVQSQPHLFILNLESMQKIASVIRYSSILPQVKI